MRLALITTIFLLLIPSALAIDVVDLQFYSHGEPLTLVSYNIMPNIDVEISVSGENFSRLIADISGIHKNQVYAQMNGYDMKTASVSTCLDMNGTFVCHLKPRYGIQMRLANSSVTIPIKLYDKDDYLTEVEQTISFSIDNEPPTVIDMRSEKCIEETCYVASGKLNNLIIQFDEGPFEKGLVRFQLGSQTRIVDECSGSTCTGKAAPTCVSGQVIPFKILRHQTFDDAYNKVTNTYSQDLTCDSIAPEVLGYNVEGAAAEYLKIGDTMVVVLNISEDIGPVSASANFSQFNVSDLVPGTCALKGTIYECTFSTTIGGEGPYYADAIIKVTDFAGNEIDYTIPALEVYGLSDEIAPSYWSMSYTSSPTKINKQTMPYIAKKIYVPLTLTSQSNIEILGVEVTDCKAIAPATNAYLGTNKPEIFNYGVGNKNPVVKFTLTQTTPASDVTSVKFNCTVKIQSRKETNIGKYYVQEQEEEELIIDYTFVNIDSPADLIKQEVLDLEKDIQDFQDWFNPIYDTISVVTQFCGGLGLLNTAGTALNAIGVPMSAVPQTKDTGETLNDIAKFLGLTSEQLAGGGEGESSGTGASLCEFLTCKAEYNNMLTSQLDSIPGFGGDDGYLNFMGYDSYSQVTNPYDSLFAAFSQLCLPAVMYNYQKLQAIDCEYLRCLSEDVALGTALVSDCQAQRSFMNCKYWVGGAFDVFPITALLDDTISMLKDSVDDPVSLFGTTLSIACKIWGEKGNFMRGTCDLAAGVSKVANFISEFLNLVNQPAKFAEPKKQCEVVLAQIDNNRGYFKTIPEAEKPKGMWDPNSQCGISGCIVTRGQDKYLVVPQSVNVVGEQSSDYFLYKKVGDRFVKVDTGGAEYQKLNQQDKDFIDGVVGDGMKNHAVYVNDFASTIPADVRDAFNAYAQSRNDYLNQQQLYLTATSDYNNYRGYYDNYQHALNKYNRNPTEDNLNALNNAWNSFESVGGEAQHTRLATESDGTITEITPSPNAATNNQGTEDTLKADQKTAKQDKNAAERQANQARRQAERIANDQWSGMDGMGTMFNTMRGFNSISNFLQDAGVMEGWGDEIDSFFQESVLGVVLDPDYRTDQICKSTLKKSDSDIAIKTSGSAASATAVRITGERSAQIVDETGAEFYDYAIAFMINPKKTGLSYEVVLKGSGGTKTIFTNITTDEKPVHIFTEDETLFVEETKLYDTACLRFHFSHWSDYFDLISSPSNNEFCDKIREVES